MGFLFLRFGLQQEWRRSQEINLLSLLFFKEKIYNII